VRDGRASYRQGCFSHTHLRTLLTFFVPSRKEHKEGRGDFDPALGEKRMKKKKKKMRD